MNCNVFIKRWVAIVLVGITMLLCTACGGKVTPSVSYKAPANLPFHFSIGKKDNNPTVEGDASWITDLGIISIHGQFELPPPIKNTIRVILMNRKTGFDHAYQVRTEGDQFAAVVNGTTVITVSHDQVVIDITNGSIRKITFKRVDRVVPEAAKSQNRFSTLGRDMADRWNAGWSRSWYKPFMLCQWSYEDSTLGKWYGLGLIWFAGRLLASVVLAVIDILLSTLFLIGQIATVSFGPSLWPGGLG